MGAAVSSHIIRSIPAVSAPHLHPAAVPGCLTALVLSTALVRAEKSSTETKTPAHKVNKSIAGAFVSLRAVLLLSGLSEPRWGNE